MEEIESVPQEEAEKFMHQSAWMIELECNRDTLLERIRDLPFIIGRDMTNKPRKFYSESDIKSACADLFQLKSSKPKIALKENAATQIDEIIGVGIARYAELLGIPHKTIRSGANAAGLKPIGKAKSGPRTVEIYRKDEIDNLEIVKKIIASKGSEMNDIGICIINGVTGIAESRYATVVGLTLKTLRLAIKQAGLQSIGYVRSGNWPVPVYDKTEVDALDVVKRSSAAMGNTINDEGIVIIKDKQCTTAFKYADVTHKNADTVNDLIREAGIEPMGYVRSAHIILPAFEKAVIDNLFERKKAFQPPWQEEIETDQLLPHDETYEKYMHQRAWLAELGCNRETLMRRIEKLPFILGKDITSKLRRFYAESDINHACADLFLPQATEDDFLVINEEIYRTALGWSVIFSISDTTASKKLSKSTPVMGRTRLGRIQKYYSEKIAEIYIGGKKPSCLSRWF